MKKCLLWLTIALCGASLFAAPVSLASKDWVRREIAAAISAAGRATVVENQDGTRTCSSPFTCDTIPDAVSVSLTFSPVRVIRNGVVTVVPFSLADLFISRAFAQSASNGEPPPDVTITITSGSYETKNLDNEGNPIKVDFNFGTGLELTLQTDKLPEMPSAVHICEFNSECFCNGYDKTEADFAAEAEAQTPNVSAKEFGLTYGRFDCWIDTGTWPDVTVNPKTKEERYWVTDALNNRIALDELDNTEAWAEGLLETLLDINSWMEKCREAYCKSKICDKENPVHDWDVHKCGSIEWKVCRRNASHTEGAEDHEMAVGKFDEAFHFCACPKGKKEPHTLSVGERELKADGTGWKKTVICLDGCGFTKTIDHTCKHERCAPCSGGDDCDVPCPTCDGKHDFSAKPSSGKCVRCACDDCGLTQRGAGVEVTRGKHVSWDNCHWLEAQESNTRSGGVHCCCECGDYSHNNGTTHDRTSVSEHYEQCASADPVPPGKHYSDYHWVITESDCKFCGDKQGVLAECQYDTPENGPTHKKIDNDRCASNRKCKQCKSGKIETAEEAGGHKAEAYTEHTDHGEVCRGWFICSQCQEQCYHDKEHVRNPSKGCLCKNGCGYQLDHVYDREDACGNKSCACGEKDPSSAESHDGCVSVGEFHFCACGKNREKHRFSNWVEISRDGKKIKYRRNCISSAWSPSGCGAKEEKESSVDDPMVRCSGDVHIAKGNACGCDCGKYNARNPHPDTSYHHFHATDCRCNCEHFHRAVASDGCPEVCKYCKRPARAGESAQIGDAPDKYHIPCKVSDGHCGCKCGRVTAEIDDITFHVFAGGDCQCLGASGNGGRYHRHMPDPDCKGVCANRDKWGIDGAHTVAPGTVAVSPTKAIAADHTKSTSSSCGCKCGDYNNSNADEWKYAANFHNSDPNDCGCFCEKGAESQVSGEFHKFPGENSCSCYCLADGEEKGNGGKHRRINGDGLCKKVCHGNNHGDGEVRGYYHASDEDGKFKHAPRGIACGCECGAFSGDSYTAEDGTAAAKFHGGKNNPEICRCECGDYHTPQEGNPCESICNTCNRLAQKGFTANIQNAEKENHTYSTSGEYCGCKCGANALPHVAEGGECYCCGKYSNVSKFGFTHGDPTLIKHINLQATGNSVSNSVDCSNEFCDLSWWEVQMEFECKNGHIVYGGAFEAGRECNHEPARCNCDCCGGDTLCDCPFCQDVAGAEDHCTCSGRNADKSKFKITNPTLTAPDFAELFAAIDRNEVVDIDGDDPVYEIAEKALLGACCNMPNLTTVKFNYVTNIAEEAFKNAFTNCPNLRTVQFARLEHVGSFAFMSAFMNSRVETLDLPKLRTTDTWAFTEMPIRHISAPLMDVIEVSTFEYCTRLESVSFGGTEIKATAFLGCRSLKEVKLPNVQYLNVAAGAFDGCSNLRTLSLPSMTNLDRFATGLFGGCAIKDLHLPQISTNAYTKAWAEYVALPAGCTIHFSDGDIVYQGPTE